MLVWKVEKIKKRPGLARIYLKNTGLYLTEQENRLLFVLKGYLFHQTSENIFSHWDVQAKSYN